MRLCLCVFMCIVTFVLERTGKSGIVFVWFLLFCFCHECPPACPPHQQTQPQQKSSIPIQARSIIHTAIAVLWHTDREGERRREAAEGRESGKDRGKRRGVLVFPKKGSFRDGICMCTQWQHPLCFTVSHVLLLSLPLSSLCSI